MSKIFLLWVLLPCPLSWSSCSWFKWDPNKSKLSQFCTLLLYLPSFNCLWPGLHMNSFCLILYILLIMHWQQQECLSYSYFSGRLHIYTEANLLHKNMCRHIHTASILWFLQCNQLSSFWFNVIFIFLRMTLFLSWNEYNKWHTKLYFLHVCIKSCLNICYLCYFWVLFIGLIVVSYL